MRLLTIRLLTIDDAPAQGWLCQGALQAPKGRISFASIPVPHAEAGNVAERDGIIRYTPSGALLTLTKQPFQIRRYCLISQYAVRHSSPCACVRARAGRCVRGARGPKGRNIGRSRCFERAQGREWIDQRPNAPLDGKSARPGET